MKDSSRTQLFKVVNQFFDLNDTGIRFENNEKVTMALKK